jgi:acetolactate synthase regulatory subunit
MGEPPREILDDVAQLVRERGDNATAMHISLLEGRDKDERSILEPILERSQYRPDPGGVFTILKSPREFSLSTLVERRGFEVVEHNTLWLVDAQTGRPHPMAITFQASQLARFLRCVT